MMVIIVIIIVITSSNDSWYLYKAYYGPDTFNYYVTL